MEKIELLIYGIYVCMTLLTIIVAINTREVSKNERIRKDKCNADNNIVYGDNYRVDNRSDD